MLQYVHHVHYVVHNRDAMVDYLEKTFGMKPDHLVVYEDRGMKDALYDVGQAHIQITEPLHPNSDIAKHLATHGPGVYHVAWGVDNLQQVARDLAAKGHTLRGKDGMTESPRGYRTSNIDPASSHGVWFQLAEG
jgi:4-hydroxyphenylpyruvate dioxygenase-like putative hemolysin